MLAGKATVDKLKKTTISGYKRIIDKYLIPEFGSNRLQDLKAAQIQRYFIEKSEKLSGKTLHQHYVILSAMCEEAVRQDILPKNPVKKVRPPRVLRKEVAAYPLTSSFIFLPSRFQSTLPRGERHF
jgi:site-specific recombinase XerC